MLCLPIRRSSFYQHFGRAPITRNTFQVPHHRLQESIGLLTVQHTVVEPEAQVDHRPDGDGIFRIGQQGMASAMTTGRLRIAPTPRMPACG